MAENFALPIPNGWFVVAYADELAAGEVKPVHFFDEELVLFRTAAGGARLMDAYCPHLGAHLGYGGVVDGEAIRCPFHGWEFAASGACQRVPYADRIPPQARLKVFPVMERNRFIYAWRHVEDAAPTWEPAHREQLSSPDWSAFDKRRWTIRTQAQELVENIVDGVHFQYVHGTAGMPNSDIRFDAHRIVSDNRAKLNTPKGEVDGRLFIEQEGLGMTFTHYTGAWDVVFVTSSTPVDRTSCMTWISFAVNQSRGMRLDRGVAKGIIEEVTGQLNQDIPIWEHKTFRARPMIASGDGPILPYRAWAKQFYSSETAKLAIEAA